MQKKGTKKRVREYEKTPRSSTYPIRKNKSFLISVVIIFAVFLVKLAPENSINKVISSVSGTTTNYVKMVKEIGGVIKKHTTGENLYILPCDGEIMSPFGERNDPITGEVKNHTGIDYDLKENSDVKATMDGVVTRVEENEFYGKFIMIDHGENTVSLYGHLNEFLVNPTDKIKKGEIIGKSGNTGRSTGAHLHFEIRVNNVPVDPKEYLL